MSGVKDTVISTPYGNIRKATSLSGTQYHAVKVVRGVIKARYFSTAKAAELWLAKMSNANAVS